MLRRRAPEDAARAVERLRFLGLQSQSAARTSRGWVPERDGVPDGGAEPAEHVRTEGDRESARTPGDRHSARMQGGGRSPRSDRGTVPRPAVTTREVPVHERRPEDSPDDASGESSQGRGLRERSGRGPLGTAADALALSWGLRRGHVVIVAVLLTLAVIGAGAMVLRERPVREDVAPRAGRVATVLPTGAGVGSPEARASPSPSFLVVHVAGKVRRPGVIRLPAGARVVDAVTEAGGAVSGVDVAALNLARPLTDGEQVLVGVTPPPGPPGAGSTSGTGPAGTGPVDGLVDLNTATAEQLEELPGVGPVLAQRILDFRVEQGGFTSIDELQGVSGIGDQKFADLRDLVTVA